MRDLAIAEDLNDYEIDILGQQPGLKIYTQITLVYPIPDASLHPNIIKTLTHGLERLSASFPWVAGQVVVENESKGNTGVFKIKPFEKTPVFVVKDLRGDVGVPSMDVMREANFPFTMLDENVIAPRNTIPGSGGEKEFDETLVFLMQANFVVGGLLLTFVTNHNAVDFVGQGQIMKLLSKACYDEPFTEEELRIGNLDRRHLIPLLEDSWKEGSELDQQRVKAELPEETKSEATPSIPLKYMWAYFTFDSTSLNTLKSLATKTISSSCSYITTDDAISSFIWQSITRVRLPRLDPTTKVLFTRSIDVRRYVDIPETYPGLVQNLAYYTETAQKLVEEPLGLVASQLRLGIDPEKSSIAYDTRALATQLARTPDKNTISFTATVDLSTDIMISSWSKVDCYEPDFNLGLGKPEAVRRPRLMDMESLVYLMPKRPDGEIAVAISLRDEDMELLKRDEEFMKYGKYVG